MGKRYLSPLACCEFHEIFFTLKLTLQEGAKQLFISPSTLQRLRVKLTRGELHMCDTCRTTFQEPLDKLRQFGQLRVASDGSSGALPLVSEKPGDGT